MLVRGARADSDRWLSFHVYYHGDLDGLLLDAVAPAMAALEAEGRVGRWYHVRYWNGGPHVRLRVLPHPGADRDRLAADARERLERYLDDCPGGPGDRAAYEELTARAATLQERFVARYPIARAHVDAIEPFQARDAVVTRPYLFDTARYGEGPLRDIAERNFAESTAVTLRVLGACRARPAALYAWSLRLMACVPVAWGSGTEAAAALFGRYRDSVAYLQPDGGERVLADRYRSFEELAGGVSEALHDVRRAGGASLHRDGGAAQAGGPAGWLSRWVTNLRACTREIEAVRGRRPVPQTLENLMVDYLHMTNNRLGLPLADELHLVHLLHLGYQRLPAS